MIPDDPELRRALRARSGEVAPEFRSRIHEALAAGRPTTNWMPVVAAAVVVVLSATSIGVLLAARNLGRPSHGGPVIRTPNASRSPSPIFMPTDVLLSAPTSNVVWAYIPLDHVLFVSTDQGTTWQQRSLPPGDGVFPGASFANEREGWLMLGSSPAMQCQSQAFELWHTLDGARTWSRVAFRGIAEAQCKEHISFIDPKHGFVAAWDDNHRPTIYRTEDGGLTWAPATLPDPPGYDTAGAGAVLHADAVRGFGGILLVDASGNNDRGLSRSYVFRSIDGGRSWSFLEPALGYEVFVTANRWLRIEEGSETTDAGKTWHPFSTDYSDAAGVASIFVFADANVGYGTVRGTLHRTVDGGRHWVIPKAPWINPA